MRNKFFVKLDNFFFASDSYNLIGIARIIFPPGPISTFIFSDGIEIDLH